MKLNREGGIEKEDRGFEMVNGGTRGFHEVIKNLFEGLGFTRRGDTHQHSVINKLVMHQGISEMMERQTLDFMIFYRSLKASPKPFSHQNEKKRRKGVTLSDTSGGAKGLRGGAIDQEGKKC